MSYPVAVDNVIGQQYHINLKPRRSVCEMDRRISQAKQSNLCTRLLRSYDKTKSKEEINSNRKTCRKLDNKRCSMRTKSSQTDRWLTTSIKKFSNDNSKLNYETYNGIRKSSVDIDDDTKSESSIEYDYIHPLSIPSTPTIQHRHVSIATILLKDDQWHQLELFIKRFSSCASLSINMNVNASTTHLVIDDSSHPLQCTFSKKIFQAVARRIFIVSIQWIEECLVRNDIIDETPFEIHGDATMSTMHLARQISTVPLFSSSESFLINCNSFQRVLTRNDLAELAVLSGATLFDPEKSTLTPSQILLVLVNPTADNHQLKTKYRSLHTNLKFLTPGYLLKSIIYQKQQPYEDFEL